MSSTPRFFLPPEAFAGETVALTPEAAHHARSVLRLRTGERVLLHDGQGTVHEAVLLDGAGKTVQARVTASRPAATEPTVRVTVAQALPKTAEKVEQVLQHGTEVGAAGFVVFAAARSVARLESGDRAEKRLARWRGIVQGACEQSGRGVLPPVTYLASTAALAARFAQYPVTLLLHEGETRPLRRVLEAAPAAEVERLLVVVGPEGGFTDEEVSHFTEAGATPVSLGPRILRTETAALVALAQILYVREAPSV